MTTTTTQAATPSAGAAFDVVPLHPLLGAEVRGLSLREPFDDATRAAFRAALLDRKVLVVRDQHLDPDELLAFAANLGHPFGREDYAYSSLPSHLQVIKLGPSAPGQRASNWHQGGTWQEHPWPFELLQLNVVPPLGGDTLYADLQAAYRALSPGLRQLVDGLRAAHSRVVKPLHGAEHDPTSTVEHPLVLVHPETGVRGLYLTSRITHLVGLPAAESAALLAFLRRHASQPPYQYRQQWQAGDLVVWDNRSTWHFAVDDYGDEERWGYKVSIEAPEAAA